MQIPKSLSRVTGLENEMYKVKSDNEVQEFILLEVAIIFAKASGLWYYIYSDEGIIRTQDDDILETIEQSQ